MAEMSSQLLFGQLIEILDTNQKWFHIRIIDDNSEGWIDEKQCRIINEKEFQLLKETPKFYIDEISKIITDKTNNTNLHLIIGSSLPFTTANEFELGGINYFYPYPKRQYRYENILEIAFKFINAPYLWGGKSPFGIDCSGFTQVVCQICNIQLPRNASQQAEVGETISFIEEAKAGDLAFFDNEEEKIIHVGIIIDSEHIIHASGQVKIERIDHHGIFNEKLNKYTHNLRIIKRLTNTWEVNILK